MNLLSVQGKGAVYLILLFLLCVILVHLLKLACIGYRTTQKKLPPQPPKQEEEVKSEPIYYLVERKKKRVKTEYDSPKEIRFQ